MKLTATQQRNAVSEGAALGLVALGYDRIRYESWKVSLAFESAWRMWPYAKRFSQVDTDIRQGLNGVHAMTRATQGKHTALLYWDREGGELTVYWRRDNFDPESREELEWASNTIEGDVPLEGWEELAQGFLDRYRR